MSKEKLIKYIQETYGVQEEHPWTGMVEVITVKADPALIGFLLAMSFDLTKNRKGNKMKQVSYRIKIFFPCRCFLGLSCLQGAVFGR